MSTPELWKRIATTFMEKPKRKPRIDIVQRPKARLRDLKPVLARGETLRAPSVLPWVEAKSVIKETKVMKHKRKVRLEPHMRKWRLPVTILGGKEGLEQEVMPFMWMKLRVKDMKAVEKAGGIEAKMISTPSKKLSINGKLLRNALFEQLYRIREENGLHEGQTIHSRRPNNNYLLGYDDGRRRLLPSMANLRQRIEAGERVRDWLDGPLPEEHLDSQGPAPLAIGDGSESHSEDPATRRKQKSKASKPLPIEA